MRFHTDEHVAEAIALGLKRRGFDVTTTQQAGLLGASDEEQLAYCRRERRVIVTHDADMLRFAAAETIHAGIAYCRNQKYKPGKLLSKVLALASGTSASDMQNRVEFL